MVLAFRFVQRCGERGASPLARTKRLDAEIAFRVNSNGKIFVLGSEIEWKNEKLKKRSAPSGRKFIEWMSLLSVKWISPSRLENVTVESCSLQWPDERSGKEGTRRNVKRRFIKSCYQSRGRGRRVEKSIFRGEGTFRSFLIKWKVRFYVQAKVDDYQLAAYLISIVEGKL